MKKSHDYSFLCYIGLFISIVLLLLPPGLRLFGKNLYEKEEKKKDVITVLSCKKENEDISSTFLNSEPQNIEYKIKGNYSINDVSEDDQKEDSSNNSLIEIFKAHAEINYDNSSDVTSYSIKVSMLKEFGDYTKTFSSLENQKAYFNTLSFSCEKTDY